jgi:hypothetical protein
MLCWRSRPIYRDGRLAAGEAVLGLQLLEDGDWWRCLRGKVSFSATRVDLGLTGPSTGADRGWLR